MTYSSLVTKTIPHHGKYHSRVGTAISRVIVHHWASTSGGDDSLANPNRNASVNYFVYSDGSVGVQVPEEYRAWTSGGPEADLPSITIEMQNSSTQVFNGNNDDPRSWAVSDKALATLAKLIADIARRYKWGSVTRSRVRGHREFDSTACPGGFLWHRLSSIAQNADDLLNNKTKSGEEPEEEDEDMAKAAAFQYTRKSDGAIVYLVVHALGSGVYHEYTAGKKGVGMGGRYNNPFATAVGTGAFAETTEGHADAIKAAEDRALTQKVEVTIPVTVDA